MVSWLTHIMGSLGYSIRNPLGDLHRRPPLLQPSGDLGGQLRAGQLAGLGTPRLGTSPLMCPPRPVLATAAVGGHLPRHRADRPLQPGSDRGERLPSPHADADLLPVRQRQPPRPQNPAIAADRPPRGSQGDDRYLLIQAAGLQADLPQRPAPSPPPQRQLPLLHPQMRGHFRNLLSSSRTFPTHRGIALTG